MKKQLPFIAIAGLLALVAACGSSAKSSAGTTAKPAESQFYVALGDSYTSGYQPANNGQPAGNTTNGFVYQLVPKLAAKGINVQLANFGCGGATTTSILQTNGCPPMALGPNGEQYPNEPQATAAENFIKAHSGKVALITVSIGGNDVTACAANPDPIGCVGTAVKNVQTNVTTLVKGLRDAAGPNVQIVGITYPDVVLGQWVAAPQAPMNQAANQSLAQISVTAFQQFINPTLKSTYESVGGTFVDVTTATGGYTPLTETTTLAPYGTVPTAVAKVCDLTFYCTLRDIHPQTSGYTQIADLVAAVVKK
ncbi:MAG: SGNH/GDSL hydrolase family protein [Acidimicrobiia bacterium]